MYQKSDFLISQPNLYCEHPTHMYKNIHNLNFYAEILIYYASSGKNLFSVFLTRPRGYKTYVSASNQSLRFISSLRMNSSFITSRPGKLQRLARLLKFCLKQVWISFLAGSE